MKPLCTFVAALILTIHAVPASRGSTLVWRTDGATGDTWGGSNWSATGTSPYSAWVSGTDASFTANSTPTFVTNTVVGNVTVADGVTVTIMPAGTWSTSGSVKTLTVGNGSILDFSSQSFSSASGTGLIKSGPGIMFSSGSTAYTGGFTLNAGTVIAGGTGAMGGGALTINGGAITANATRNFDTSGTSKFTSISFGGDFTLGGTTTGVSSGNGSTSAGLTFGSATVGEALGATSRTITIANGDTGAFAFNGAFTTATPGVGLTIAGATGATFAFGNSANTYTGATNFNGPDITFASGAFSNTSALNVTGSSTLTWATGETDDLSAKLAAGTGIAGGATSTLYITSSSTRVPFANGLIGSGGIAKDGSGVLTLSGASTYTGGTTLSNGTIQIGAASAGSVGSIASSSIGTGALTVNGGGISSDGTTARTLLNAVTFGANVSLGNATNSGVLTFQGGATLTGSRTLTINSPVTFSGAISESGGSYMLTKSGIDILTLSGANNYSGGTAISSGMLLASNTSGSATGAGAVSVTGSGVLGGTGTVNGAVAVGNGTGGQGFNGTITAGSGATSAGIPGVLTINNTLSMSATGTAAYAVKLDPTNSTAATSPGDGTSVSTNPSAVPVVADQLRFSGLSASSGFIVDPVPISSGVAGQEYSWIIATDTTGTDDFDSILSTLNGQLVQSPGGTWGLSTADGGSELVLDETAAPEPTSLILLGAVFSPMMLSRRRRRAACVQA